jgi:hypothetical protein
MRVLAVSLLLTLSPALAFLGPVRSARECPHETRLIGLVEGTLSSVIDTGILS